MFFLEDSIGSRFAQLEALAHARSEGALGRRQRTRRLRRNDASLSLTQMTQLPTSLSYVVKQADEQLVGIVLLVSLKYRIHLSERRNCTNLGKLSDQQPQLTKNTKVNLWCRTFEIGTV